MISKSQLVINACATCKSFHFSSDTPFAICLKMFKTILFAKPKEQLKLLTQLSAADREEFVNDFKKIATKRMTNKNLKFLMLLAINVKKLEMDGLVERLIIRLVELEDVSFKIKMISYFVKWCDLSGERNLVSWLISYVLTECKDGTSLEENMPKSPTSRQGVKSLELLAKVLRSIRQKYVFYQAELDILGEISRHETIILEVLPDLTFKKIEKVDYFLEWILSETCEIRISLLARVIHKVLSKQCLARIPIELKLADLINIHSLITKAMILKVSCLLEILYLQEYYKKSISFSPESLKLIIQFAFSLQRFHIHTYNLSEGTDRFETFLVDNNLDDETLGSSDTKSKLELLSPGFLNLVMNYLEFQMKAHASPFEFEVLFLVLLTLNSIHLQEYGQLYSDDKHIIKGLQDKCVKLVRLVLKLCHSSKRITEVLDYLPTTLFNCIFPLLKESVSMYLTDSGGPVQDAEQIKVQMQLLLLLSYSEKLQLELMNFGFIHTLFSTDFQFGINAAFENVELYVSILKNFLRRTGKYKLDQAITIADSTAGPVHPLSVDRFLNFYMLVSTEKLREKTIEFQYYQLLISELITIFVEFFASDVQVMEELSRDSKLLDNLMILVVDAVENRLELGLEDYIAPKTQTLIVQLFDSIFKPRISKQNLLKPNGLLDSIIQLILTINEDSDTISTILMYLVARLFSDETITLDMIQYNAYGRTIGKFCQNGNDDMVLRLENAGRLAREKSCQIAVTSYNYLVQQNCSTKEILGSVISVCYIHPHGILKAVNLSNPVDPCLPRSLVLEIWRLLLDNSGRDTTCSSGLDESSTSNLSVTLMETEIRTLFLYLSQKVSPPKSQHRTFLLQHPKSCLIHNILTIDDPQTLFTSRGASADIEIVLQYGQESISLYFTKAMLISCSAFFERLFCGSFAEAETKQLVLDQVDPTIFAAILLFCLNTARSTSVTSSKNTVLDLDRLNLSRLKVILLLANQYLIQDLGECLKEYLIDLCTCLELCGEIDSTVKVWKLFSVEEDTLGIRSQIIKSFVASLVNYKYTTD